MTESAVSFTKGRDLALVNAQRSRRFDWRWFDPLWWGDCARPVDAGGRGSAWFIHADEGDLVLRFYERGGLMRRLSRAIYLYLGPEHARSIAEFRMLASMRDLNLPVPEPVAAGLWRCAGVGYRAAILVERLGGTTALGSLAPTLEQTRWVQVGATIRRFHNHGIIHADLNCFNILLSDQYVYLIDFDKGHQRNAGYGAGLSGRNLERLHRSLCKLDWDGATISLEAAWRALLDGYHSV